MTDLKSYTQNNNNLRERKKKRKKNCKDRKQFHICTNTFKCIKNDTWYADICTIYVYVLRWKLMYKCVLVNTLRNPSCCCCCCFALICSPKIKRFTLRGCYVFFSSFLRFPFIWLSRERLFLLLFAEVFWWLCVYWCMLLIAECMNTQMVHTKISEKKQKKSRSQMHVHKQNVLQPATITTIVLMWTFVVVVAFASLHRTECM